MESKKRPQKDSGKPNTAAGQNTRKEGAGDDTPMSLNQHLRELRSRIIVVAVVFVIAFAGSLSFAAQIVEHLIHMGSDYGYAFVFIAPQELIMVYFQIALIAGVVLAGPVLFYEGYRFMVPALTKREQRAVRLSLLFGLCMFILGILFAYRVSLPFMLRFLIGLKTGVSIEASISIQSFVGFLMTIFLIFGVVFEMPVVTSLLTQLGILKPSYLLKARKLAIVAIFFVAAVITPPDVVSQTMVALPMILLYQLSIGLSMMLYKKREKAEDGEA